MFTLTSALFVTLFATSWIFVLCQGTQELKVTAGEDATLQCQCQSHGDADIKYIEWNRTDLKSDLYVFLFRDNNSNAKNQHESFRGRVELRDPEMKNGDASVILKNVNTNDTGTYECLVREGNNTGKPVLISTIKLTVTETLELNVTVKAGEDATLQCRSPGGADITVLRWTRADLKSDDSFVFYRNFDQINGEYQNSMFRGRVELRDPKRKNGDASVILKNVTTNDAGTYECRIAVRNSGRRKRVATEPISTVKLSVIGTQEVEGTAGEDATLPCQSHGGADITVLRWTRADLKSDDGFVFYRNFDQINGEYQNSMFHGRVELQDPEMKDGDVSVILKNVNINDAGTYECRIAVNNSGRRKRVATEPISTVKLSVIDGHKDEEVLD